MPDEPARDQPADDSPEEMMGGILNPGPSQQPRPPEDYDSHLSDASVQRFARPEDLPLAPPEQGPADAAAEPFIEMRNRAATLSDLLAKEEISFDEYQRLLYEAMVQDEAGHWWMIDAENNHWYRHDPERNQWQEDYPAALREHEGEQAEVDADATVTEYELPDSYSQPAAGDPITDERGLRIGEIPPTKDELYTVPGGAALVDELPGQARTLAGDAEYSATMHAPAQEADSIPRAIDGDYDLQASPLARELLESRGRRRRRLLLTLTAGLGIVMLGAAIIATGAMVLWYRDTVAPYAEGIAALGSYTPAHQTARIFDADGNLIAALNSQETGARTTVPLDRISPYMVHAIVSQENERFFEDPGFDPIAIVRAFLQNLQGGGIESGASTITQQIARNLVLHDREVSAQRKLKEILVALEIANRYDKNFILELYLNDIFFANQNYGVEAAANFYFGISAAQLNYAQSALLASIVPAPLRHDPVKQRDAAIAGMRATMRKMLEVGCLQFRHDAWLERGPFCIVAGAEARIDGESALLVKANQRGEIIGGVAILQIAEIETARFQPSQLRQRYPHFVEFARAAVAAELGVEALYRRGLKIYTTLNPALQDEAQAALSDQVRRLAGAATGVNTGAVMVSDPQTGAIRALVGSHDFYDAQAGQVNNALTWQQPGSAIKPFVYLAALQESDADYLTPASIIWDVPLVEDLGAGGIYEPRNVDRRFHGPVSARAALQNSYNVPAVKVFRDYVGAGRFANLADAVGLRFPDESLISLASALGANEVTLYDMMGAYAALANGGQHIPLYAIERVTESVAGEEREIPLEREPARQAISPSLAYLMQNILSDDSARAPSFAPGGSMTLARIGLPALNTIAAKTGTTNGARDLWTMGFSRAAVVGVWLGTADNAPTYNTSGHRSAAPLWNTVMTAASHWYAPQPFENPGGVVAREICRLTGTLNYPGCPAPSTGLFMQDQFPPPPEEAFLQRLAVDSWTLLRANEFCAGHVIEQNFASLSEPAALEWLNDSADGSAYAEELGLRQPVTPPPEEACAQGQQLPLVNISSPNEGAVIRGAVELRGQVQAPDFDRFELLYASAAEPETFYPISASLAQMPAYGAHLGSWDTVAAQIPDGAYILRLAASSLQGGHIHFDLNLRVDNSTLPPAEPAFGPGVDRISTPVPASQ